MAGHLSDGTAPTTKRKGIDADPESMLHPGQPLSVISLMTSSARRRGFGTGDQRPPVRRAGSDDWRAVPSRYGDERRGR